MQKKAMAQILLWNGGNMVYAETPDELDQGKDYTGERAEFLQAYSKKRQKLMRRI